MTTTTALAAEHDAPRQAADQERDWATPPLDAAEYQRKEEGGYFTGIPLFNYDSNMGFGLGARAYYYFDGQRSDPWFAYTPYLYRVFLQAFLTTGGFQYHWLDLDTRRTAGTPLRFRAQIALQRNSDQHYFGVGARTMEPLGISGSTERFRRFEDYQAALNRIDATGQTRSRYDSYRLLQPLALIGAEYPLLRGLVRPLFGIGLTYSDFSDYTGRWVRAVDADGAESRAPMGLSRLAEDCAAQRIVGCTGGFNNFLRLGLSFDTRDYDPDPNRGVFIDAALDLGTRVLGSGYEWARAMLSPRVYLDLLPGWTDLVLAVRGTFQVQSAGVPFFGMNLIPYTEEPRTGLGGLRTLRGYKQDRFVGPVMTLLNTELRWTFLRFDLLGQKLALIAVPFVDFGAVHDRVRDLKVTGWKRGQGLALRVSWNLAMVMTGEYGVSEEDSGLYLNFNHMF